MKEPFLINPVRMRKRKTIHKRISKIHKRGGEIKMKRRRKSHRRRRNPGVEELMILNRARRKSSHRRRLSGTGSRGLFRVSSRSKLAPRSRGHILNPAGIMSALTPPMDSSIITQFIGVTAGFVAVRMLPKYVLPLDWQTGTKAVIGKVGTVIVTTAVAGMVFKSREIRRAVFLGGLLSIGIDLLAQALPGTVMGGLNLVIPSSSLRMAVPNSSVYGADINVPSANIPVNREEETY